MWQVNTLISSVQSAEGFLVKCVIYFSYPSFEHSFIISNKNCQNFMLLHLTMIPLDEMTQEHNIKSHVMLLHVADFQIQI